VEGKRSQKEEEKKRKGRKGKIKEKRKKGNLDISQPQSNR
jgi:hypothetical protein